MRQEDLRPTDEHLMDVFRIHYTSPIGHKAYDELYFRWKARIYAYHFSTMHSNATIAEELTQATFCRVIDKRNLFDPRRGTFGVWLYTLASNLKKDFARGVTYRATQVLDTFMEVMGEPSPVELRILIAECLDELEERDRQIMFLTTIEGFTQTETGRILNIPVGTVGRRRAEAILHLQAAFQRSANLSKHEKNKEK
jgi:RNA polymerase sigma-70 factor (ECF subfamily)